MDLLYYILFITLHISIIVAVVVLIRAICKIKRMKKNCYCFPLLFGFGVIIEIVFIVSYLMVVGKTISFYYDIDKLEDTVLTTAVILGINLTAILLFWLFSKCGLEVKEDEFVFHYITKKDVIVKFSDIDVEKSQLDYSILDGFDDEVIKLTIATKDGKVYRRNMLTAMTAGDFDLLTQVAVRLGMLIKRAPIRPKTK